MQYMQFFPQNEHRPLKHWGWKTCLRVDANSWLYPKSGDLSGLLRLLPQKLRANPLKNDGTGR